VVLLFGFLPGKPQTRSRSMNPATKSIQLKIKELSAQSRVIVVRIKTLRGSERGAAWDDKRALGDRTRHALLAYAFVRQRSYASQEQRCRRPLSLTLVAAVIAEATDAPTAEVLEAWIGAARDA
jgi:hypothetical protein